MKAFLFDFDGTLADTAQGIVCTMQETFREMGLEVPSEDEIRPTIGLPLHVSIKMLGHLDDEGTLRGTDTYRRIFPQFAATHVTIFPGVAETLEAFAAKGVRMAICTSRSVQSLDMILERHGLAGFFETRITNSDNLPSKPAPDMVLALLERMHLSKDDAIVVGDTTFDINMGSSAGCSTVAVTYGNHPRETLASANPTWMIDRFDELKSLF